MVDSRLLITPLMMVQELADVMGEDGRYAVRRAYNIIEDGFHVLWFHDGLMVNVKPSFGTLDASLPRSRALSLDDYSTEFISPVAARMKSRDGKKISWDYFANGLMTKDCDKEFFAYMDVKHG
jgi:hypothetical protein